jgi:hypothetical protein
MEVMVAAESGKWPIVPECLPPELRELMERSWSYSTTSDVRPTFREILQKCKKARFMFWPDVDGDAVMDYVRDIEEEARRAKVPVSSHHVVSQ